MKKEKEKLQWNCLKAEHSSRSYNEYLPSVEESECPESKIYSITLLSPVSWSRTLDSLSRWFVGGKPILVESEYPTFAFSSVEGRDGLLEDEAENKGGSENEDSPRKEACSSSSNENGNSSSWEVSLASPVPPHVLPPTWVSCVLSLKVQIVCLDAIKLIAITSEDENKTMYTEFGNQGRQSKYGCEIPHWAYERMSKEILKRQSFNCTISQNFSQASAAS